MTRAVALAAGLLATQRALAAQETPQPWTVGSRVHAGATAVCARGTAVASAPCGTLEPALAPGTIRAGPATDAGVVFWSVAFDGSVTGWARQLYLVLDSLAVVPPPPTRSVARVVLSTAGTRMITALGGTYQASAVALDSTGARVVTPVTWRASDPAIASVSATGLVTAVGVGTDSVWAMAGGKGAFFLVLSGPPPAPPPPAPVAWSIRQGWLMGLLLARPPCVVPLSPGAVTCGPYPVADDSTGLVVSHLTVTFTVSP